ncbi:hypothetical protein MKZ42_11020 [Pseudoalteromonas shioyasakiensis]|uniref:Tetratricopeptide repeat protein n=1 Tax=Pseudoalteromonas shioyasakiensis TaxID=1190813 RepID=A0ABT6TXM2_9GAMM|nr:MULTISPECIES: hypothetical protein [Pseudoalteromonas]MDI4668664.1 hypothetical protein [Pseudoalteromonas shioyasakiensis]MDI4673789.1 hypothetical protein [Pseudoalteromonas shioyasakiensis]MDI4685662.1 hypothetical protein [Pseudoalteromonas shioyasakiensis]MDI4703866.1 hypothetical protein [Pseudoalteromonas shioyasakiensis]NUJ20911.1 hypothetical protein [Pseudoalteromonas sp. 0802]
MFKVLTLAALVSLAVPTNANEITAEFLKKELKLAHSQYIKGSSDSALYALNALSRILELDSAKTLQTEVGPNNLAFTYLRIGLIYEHAGDQQQANSYFAKAMNAHQGEKLQLAELKAYITKLDKSAAHLI